MLKRQFRSLKLTSTILLFIFLELIIGQISQKQCEIGVWLAFVCVITAQIKFSKPEVDESVMLMD